MKKKTTKKVAKKTVKKTVKKAVKKAVKKTAKKAVKKLKPNEKLVKFQIQAEAGSEVYVAGSFNAWDPKANKLRKVKDMYAASIVLQKGRHEYKFVINGVWHVDPNCPEWQPNSMGSINSLLTVE
jgi:1,4-alpha-glucan branching enzyme